MMIDLKLFMKKENGLQIQLIKAIKMKLVVKFYKNKSLEEKKTNNEF